MINDLMKMNMSGFSGRTRVALIKTLVACKARLNEMAVVIGGLKEKSTLMEANLETTIKELQEARIEIANKDAIIEGLKKELETISSIKASESSDKIIDPNPIAEVADSSSNSTEENSSVAVITVVAESQTSPDGA